MPIPAILDGKLSLPVIGSPLFIVSTPDLVIAQCKAGIVGSFPALNARPKEQLAIWLERITTELAAYKATHPQAKLAPFAVNQIVHASNDRLVHDMETCVRFKVPIVITSLRPPGEIVAGQRSAHRGSELAREGSKSRASSLPQLRGGHASHSICHRTSAHGAIRGNIPACSSGSAVTS